MAATALQKYTRRRLAQMARDRHLAGWHAMRKAELIEALIATPVPAPASRGATSGLSSHLHRLVVIEGGEDRLDVQPVSPFWLRVRWSLSAASRDRMCVALGPQHHQALSILRLYDVTSEDVPVREWICDVAITPEAGEWYLQVPGPGRTYQVQWGVLDTEGGFHRFDVAPRVDVPGAGSVRQTQPRGGISPNGRVVRRRRPASSDRRAKTAAAVGAGASPGEDGLPLHIEVDVVLHGSAGSDVDVSILGRPVDVGAGGSFAIRLSVAEGREVIPVVATSRDRQRRRTAVVAIERKTRMLGPETM